MELNSIAFLQARTAALVTFCPWESFPNPISMNNVVMGGGVEKSLIHVALFIEPARLVVLSLARLKHLISRRRGGAEACVVAKRRF